MTKLNSYLDDGANYQAKAVLAFLQAYEGIEESWNKKTKRYEADIKVARWENCREQGYIVSLNSKKWLRQINIIFFEHRNSDSIHAVKWEQRSMNSITIETAKFDNIYENKHDTSFSVVYGKVVEMSDWIWERLVKFWIETKDEEAKYETR